MEPSPRGVPLSHTTSAARAVPLRAAMTLAAVAVAVNAVSVYARIASASALTRDWYIFGFVSEGSSASLCPRRR